MKVVVIYRTPFPRIFANRANIVNRLRPGESDQVPQTLREALLQLRAESFVVGVDCPVYQLDAAVAWPGAPLFDGAAIVWTCPVQRVIVITHPFQLVSGRAQVSQFQRHVFAKLVLNVERPLKNIRGTATSVVSQHERLAEA